MNKDTFHMIERVKRLGINDEDAWALRRISMQLHRWNERECNGEVERDETTNKTFAVYENGRGQHRRYPCPDLETGANKRLAAIMAHYPALTSYVQGDPRGAALYILSPGDVPEGESVDSYYSRGVAVYK